MKNAILILIMLAFWCTPATAGEPATPQADPEPFFSEYVEGAASKAPGDLALEIFNPTLMPIDLGNMGYFIEIYSDGSLTATMTIFLNGFLPPNGTFVLVASSASAGLQALADQVETFFFDGNDLIALGFMTGQPKGPLQLPTYLDGIGQLGIDPTPPGYWGVCPLCTANVDLRRDPTVLYGDITLGDLYDVAAGWIANPPEDWTDLGTHIPVPVELSSFIIE